MILFAFLIPVIAKAGKEDKIVQVKRERVGGDGSGNYEDVNRNTTVESHNDDGTVAKVLITIKCFGAGTEACPTGMIANPDLPPLAEVPVYLQNKTEIMFALAEKNISGGTGKGSYSELFTVVLASGETETYTCVLTWTSTDRDNVSMEVTFSQVLRPSTTN